MNDIKSYTFKSAPPPKKRKRRSRKPLIITIVLGVVFFLIVFSATFLITPSVNSGVKFFSSSVSINSLSFGEDIQKDGVITTGLIASAVTKGSASDKTKFPQTLAEIVFEGDDGDVSYTLLYNSESGKLASMDKSGNVISLFNMLAKFVFSDEQSAKAINTSNPSPIYVGDTLIEPSWFDTTGKTISGETISVSGGSDESFSFTSKTESAPMISGISQAMVTVYSPNGGEVFSDDINNLSNFKATSNGKHLFEIKPNNEVTYNFDVDFQHMPEISISANKINQAGSFVIYVKNIDEDVSAELSLSYDPVFKRDGNIQWAYVPIGYRQQPGNYTVEVTAGGHFQTFDIEVVDYDFGFESFELVAPAPSETEAIPPELDLYQVINPLYLSYDPNTYWEGLFIPPVPDTAEGYWVSSPFGRERLIYYTGPYGGFSSTLFHVGVDFACQADTPVLAPNHGKVLFAGDLAQSGGTMLIEHGNGLHSVYYHLNDTLVETGDMVTKGQEIALVGSTGFWSTGPHLHFAMMIGDYNIDPTHVLEGTSEIYQMGDITGKPVTDTTDFRLADGFA